MKSHFISVALLSCIFASASSFAEMPKGLGLHLGVNFADIVMNSAMTTGSTFGVDIGGTYDYAVTEDVSFLPGVNYMQRGFAFDVGLTEVNLKIAYLEFPMLFQARFTGAPIIPFFIGGPVLGLKLATNCSVNGGTCTVYDDSGVKALHMGLDLGAGVIFPLENGAGLSTQLRYHLGLTRMASGLADPRHRGLLVEVGYLF